MKRIFLVSAVLLLAGCESHWAFPPGRTLADFRADEVNCQNALAFESCLQARGYRKVSYEEMQAINRANAVRLATPILADIVAFDVRSGELFIGKTESKIGVPVASVTVEGVATKLVCTGSAKMVTATANAVGSIGESILLCRDGRTVNAKFVYETARAGWGSGTDDRGREYRFKFGDLNVDTAELRRQFERMLTDEKTNKTVGERGA